MTTEQIIRHLRAIADQGLTEHGRHGVISITVWQAARAADELERLAHRCADLEAALPQPSLFDTDHEGAHA